MAECSAVVLADAHAIHGSECGSITLGVLAFCFSVQLTVWALNLAYTSWWHDPAKAEALTKAYAEGMTTSGTPDLDAVFAISPCHISEYIGDEGSGHGAVFLALAKPALILASIAGFMIHSSLPGFATYIGCYSLNFLRAVTFPVGLMLVVHTPYISQVPKDVLACSRSLSELEIRHIAEWKALHAFGFMLGVILPIIPQLCGGVAGAFWFATAGSSCDELSWPLLAQLAWITLKYGQIIACIFSLVSFVNFFIYMAADSEAQLRNFKCVTTEFNTLVLAGFAAVTGYVSILFAPGWSSPSTFHISFLVLLYLWVMYSLYMRLFGQGLKRNIKGTANNTFCSVFVTMVWDKSDLVKAGTEDMLTNRGSLTVGLCKKTGKTLWNLRAVQPGRPEMTDEEYAGYGAFGVMEVMSKPLGAFHDKWAQLIFRPVGYVAVSAIDLHELDDDSLARFNANLSSVLEALNAPDTLFFPFGSKFKMGRQMPFVRLSMTDYATEIESIDPRAEANTLWPQPEEDEVAFDISEQILGREELTLLRKGGLACYLAGGTCRPMYDAFGSIVHGIRPPAPTKRLMHTLKNLDSPVTYEVQVRGVRNANPTVVLRIPREHSKKLPGAWGELREVAVWPQSYKPPEVQIVS